MKRHPCLTQDLLLCLSFTLEYKRKLSPHSIVFIYGTLIMQPFSIIIAFTLGGD